MQSSAARSLFSSAGFTFIGVEAVHADKLPVWVIVVAAIAAVALVLVLMIIVILVIVLLMRLVV